MADVMKRGQAATLRQPSHDRPPHERQLLRICGLASVRALFERDPGRAERLFFEERMKGEVGPFCQMLARERKPYRQIDKAELARVAGTVLHGGVVAIARRGRSSILLRTQPGNGRKTASLC